MLKRQACIRARHSRRGVRREAKALNASPHLACRHNRNPQDGSSSGAAGSAPAARGYLSAALALRGPAAAKRLHKALEAAGCTARDPLVALAQLALPLGALAKGGGREAAAPLAASAAVLCHMHPALAELALAAYRCVCQRLQTLHEQALRQASSSSAAAGSQRQQPEADAPHVADATEGGEEGGDGVLRGLEGELRTLSALLLAPASSAPGGCAPRSLIISTAAEGAEFGFAAAAGAAASVYEDLLATLRCAGPWAQHGQLAEALQPLLLAATGGAATTTAAPAAAAGVGAQEEAEGSAALLFADVLRRLRRTCAQALPLPEFQGLPGVCHALAEAWSTAVAGTLEELVRGLADAAGSSAPAANGNSSAEEAAPRGGGGSSSKKRMAREAAAAAAERGTPAGGAAVGERLHAFVAMAAAPEGGSSKKLCRSVRWPHAGRAGHVLAHTHAHACAHKRVCCIVVVVGMHVWTVIFTGMSARVIESLKSLVLQQSSKQSQADDTAWMSLSVHTAAEPCSSSRQRRCRSASRIRSTSARLLPPAPPPRAR